MIKLDYQTLAIVTSILYLTFSCVFLSLSRVLEGLGTKNYDIGFLEF